MSPLVVREMTGFLQGFLSLFFRFFGHLHLSRSSCGVGCGCGNVNTPVFRDVKVPGGLNDCVSVVGSGGSRRAPGPGDDHGKAGARYSKSEGAREGAEEGDGRGEEAGEREGDGDGAGDVDGCATG